MCGSKLEKSDAFEYESGYPQQEPWVPIGPYGVLDCGDCPLCGWWYAIEVPRLGPSHASVSAAELRQLDINENDLLIEELGSYLRQNYDSIFALTPRRFEELVTHILRGIGLEAVHTGRSGDGGADIVLFRNDSAEKWGIVECKRYSKTRRVGVEVLRSLVGAAIDWDVRRAYLVTSAAFTHGVFRKSADFRQRGYELELIEATELLKALGAYDRAMPSLEKLTEEKRQEIIRANIRVGDTP